MVPVAPVPFPLVQVSLQTVSPSAASTYPASEQMEAPLVLVWAVVLAAALQ